MNLSTACPIPALHLYVRCFEQREARLEHGEVIYPITARPEQFLEFYLQERYLIHSHHSGTREPAPPSVVVGPSTYRRVDLVLHGRFEVFTIHFQPSGFFQLFGVPMHNLADRAYEARSVIGDSITELEARLADAQDFRQRVEVATSSLTQRLTTMDAPDAVARIANQVLSDRGVLQIQNAAARAGLSVRHFERRFLEQVGVAPRRYARIVRFQAALNIRLNAERPWTDIAHDLGYYDQMHMVHDFRMFSGESPTRLSGLFAANAQRWA
jgi:AraC-like DNA-binding protein